MIIQLLEIWRIFCGHSFFSSFQEWAYAMARRPSSVRPSVNFCANRFFSQANGRITTKLSQDGLQVSLHQGCAQGQGQDQRSRDTGTFVLARKSLLLPGKWPDRDQTCTRWSPGKPASRVAQGQGQRSRDTRTFLDSWNELLRHWRSGSFLLCICVCSYFCMSLWNKLFDLIW